MPKDYKDTLQLPKTKFPMRAGLAQKEPEILKKWEEERLYNRIIEKNKGKTAYTLHDGPPYANGHIHHGHVLNKVLKDIIVRSRNMMGNVAEYIPGWDCHGLPIEIQVDKNLGAKKQEMDPVEFRNRCREYASEFVAIQRDEFKRLGCIGRWEKPYLTMNYEYEAQITRELAQFVRRGAIYRGRKPVYWCTQCNGPLAEFEVEYMDHDSYSIYVKFEACDDLKQMLPDEIKKYDKIFFVIWTTTPWTLPANLAIALGPGIKYAALKNKENDEVYVVADDLKEDFITACNLEIDLVGKVDPVAIENTNCKHPFIDRKSKMVLATYVTLESGTGCVHTAPGHGMEDYLTGVKYGLEILTPVDGAGKFTEEAGEKWAGMDVWEANLPIIQMLKDTGYLLNKVGEKITHSYPHCWRHKTPLLYRATSQWFVSMDTNDLRSKALEGIKSVRWIPAWGEDRINGMVENRPDWCISRQRLWGMPIIAFRCAECGEVILDADSIERIADIFEKEGANAWFAKPVEELITDGFACKCGSKKFEKDIAILDVWFDSGVSYKADVGLRQPENIPVDLYIEGTDQHRGWFQAALLCGLGARDTVPYKTVLTHGFVVDHNGKAYSKSRILEAKKQGVKIDYIPPDDVIKKQGAEILRLWTAAEDYRYEITFSSEILKGLAEAYRKIRNTLRFMLGNLSDFDPVKNSVPVTEMTELDRWALGRWHKLANRFNKAYDDYEFHMIYHQGIEFCASLLSSIYLDILKDRLYCSGRDSKERRSAQTVMHTVTEGLLQFFAPILVFTTEEAWQYLPALDGRADTVHLTDFPKVRDEWFDEALVERWDKLMLVRSEVFKELEKARKEKNFGQSLLVKVTVSAKGEMLELLKKYEALLPEIFIVSQVAVSEEKPADAADSEKVDGLGIAISMAEGKKCERCWVVLPQVGENEKHPDLCPRCAKVIDEMGA